MAAARVAPQPVRPGLVDKVEVRAPVAIDIRQGNSIAVVVVIGPVVPPRVIDDAVVEGKAAGGLAVGEAEITEDRIACGCGHLGLTAALQPRGI